jgi:hypothetical protein
MAPDVGVGGLSVSAAGLEWLSAGIASPFVDEGESLTCVSCVYDLRYEQISP